MPELVYILTNPTMPDLIKIGKTTTSLKERLRALSSHAGVPVAFECYYCCEVEDSSEVEKRLHYGFGDHRINSKREFFKVNPERVKVILEGWALRDMTPGEDFTESLEEQNALNRARSIKPAFTFSMLNIPISSQLTFLRDETIISIVVSDREVEFKGSKYFLSQLTVNLLKEHYEWKSDSARGPDYWTFDSETLTERRLRMEAEGEI